MAPSRAEELLATAEAEAWSAYLDATRDQSPLRYEELEPWAWKRLTNTLAQVAVRRHLLVDRDREDDGA